MKSVRTQAHVSQGIQQLCVGAVKVLVGSRPSLLAQTDVTAAPHHPSPTCTLIGQPANLGDSRARPPSQRRQGRQNLSKQTSSDNTFARSRYASTATRAHSLTAPPATMASRTPTPDGSTRDRLPNLFEVLSRRTVAPVDLFSFYIYMRDVQRSVDYLDFWYVSCVPCACQMLFGRPVYCASERQSRAAASTRK